MFYNHLLPLLRSIRKRKMFAFINMSGLAVGLGSSLLILLFVQHELSYDDYHEKGDSIYRITRAFDYPSGYNHHFARVPDTWVNELPSAFPEIEQLLRLQEFRNVHLRIGQTKFREEKAFATDPYIFEVFSFPLIKGNPETALSEPHSVVLTESMAKKYFPGQDPMGKTIEFLGADEANTQKYEVRGILEDVPPTTHFDVHFLTSFQSPEERAGWAYVYLLLRAGTKAAQLESKFPAFIDEHMDEEAASRHNRFHLQPITDIHLKSHLARELQPNGRMQTIYIFSAAALFILLLAGINFVNLSIAQSAERAREMGMRKILGATRRQLISYLLGESCLFAFFTFLLSLGLIYYSMPLFQAVAGAELEVWNVPVLASFLVAALIAGLLAGLYPAARATAPNPMAALKDGSVILPASRLPLRKVLVASQFVISIGLMVCTAITYQQFQYLQKKNLGFSKEQVLAIPDIPRGVLKHYFELKQSLEDLPGVSAVSASMEEPSKHIRDAGMIYAEGKVEEGKEVVMDILPAGRNFIELMDMDMLAGQSFQQLEALDGGTAHFPDDGGEMIAMVNEKERYYILNEAAIRAAGWEKAEEALGKAFSWNNEVINFQRGPVIGVVKDFNFTSLHSAVRPTVLVYEPPFFGCILVKAQPENMAATLAKIQEKWNELLPNYAFDYLFLDNMFARLYAAEQRQAKVLGIFALIAIFIAALGILGLAAIAAKQRRRELSIRKILGASAAQLVRLLSREFVELAMIANLIAWPLAYWLMREWLQGFAYRINIQPALFLLAGLLTLTVALLAVSWHSIRAALANPAEALRSE